MGLSMRDIHTERGGARDTFESAFTSIIAGFIFEENSGAFTNSRNWRVLESRDEFLEFLSNSLMSFLENLKFHENIQFHEFK